MNIKDQIATLPSSVEVLEYNDYGALLFHSVPPGRHLMRWHGVRVTLPLPHLVVFMLARLYCFEMFDLMTSYVMCAKQGGKPHRLFHAPLLNVRGEDGGVCLGARVQANSLTALANRTVDAVLGRGFNAHMDISGGSSSYTQHYATRLPIPKWKQMAPTSKLLLRKLRRGPTFKAVAKVISAGLPRSP